MKKNIHVIHILEGLEEGGVLTFLVNVCNSTPKIKHTLIYGLRNEYYLPEKIKKSFVKNNIDFKYWKYAKREINIIGDLIATIKLMLILLKHPKQSVIHLHSSKAGFIGRIVCFLLRRKKVIYTPHGISFLSGKSFFSKLFYAFLEKTISFFPAKIICVSRSERQVLKKLYIRSSFIYNGFKKQKEVAKPTSTPFLIVTTGRIMKQKDPEFFNAIAELLLFQKNIKFIWVGDGTLKYLLTSPNIEITGWLSSTDLMKILKKSSVFLSSSKYEGLSFSILEAMSLGLPLILRNCVGNVDMVSRSTNGSLFATAEEAKDAILQLYSNFPLLLKKGKESKKLFTQSFNLNKMVSKYREVYEKI